MSGRHRDQYITKLLVGFTSLSGCIFLVYYSILESQAEEGDWYFWAIVASFLLCAGIYFCTSAMVHKVKADFSRKQKSREEQRKLRENKPD